MQTLAHTIQLRRQAQQGQTIVIALLVLLLLGFIGGLFSSIVTRNLRSAARSNRIQTADYYAEAGIRFADDQLTHNPEGADWRPPLQFQIAATGTTLPKDTVGLRRYNAAKTGLATVDPNDPDKPFLDQGFTRYNIGTGRFLLRVTYDPAGTLSTGPSDPVRVISRLNRSVAKGRSMRRTRRRFRIARPRVLRPHWSNTKRSV